MFQENENFKELIGLLQSKDELIKEEVEKVVHGFLNHPIFDSVMFYSGQSVRIVEHSNFRYLYVSENIQNIVGYTAEEFKKGGIFFTYRRVHPADFLSFAKITFKVYQALNKMSTNEKLSSRFKFDSRFKCKDGSYKRILQHAHILSLDSNGKPSIVLFISSDISKLKKKNIIDYELSTYYPEKGFVTVLEAWDNVDTDIPLSLRELEIVKLIAEGLTEKEIGSKLFISTHTVKNHRKNILHKTGIKNAPELVKVAVNNGWV